MKKIIFSMAAMLLLISLVFAGDGNKSTFKTPPGVTSTNSTYQFRGKITQGGSADASVSDDGNGNLTVSTYASPVQPGDLFILESPYLVIGSNGSVTIPNDGNTYWIVPFDPTGTPTKGSAMMAVTVTCGCESGSFGPTNNSGCSMSCNGTSATCAGTCFDGWGSGTIDCPIRMGAGGGNLGSGSYVILKANSSLVFNGVTYH